MLQLGCIDHLQVPRPQRQQQWQVRLQGQCCCARRAGDGGARPPLRSRRPRPLPRLPQPLRRGTMRGPRRRAPPVSARSVSRSCARKEM